MGWDTIGCDAMQWSSQAHQKGNELVIVEGCVEAMNGMRSMDFRSDQRQRMNVGEIFFLGREFV